MFKRVRFDTGGPSVESFVGTINPVLSDGARRMHFPVAISFRDNAGNDLAVKLSVSIRFDTLRPGSGRPGAKVLIKYARYLSGGTERPLKLNTRDFEIYNLANRRPIGDVAPFV